ncbi:hypothetical protein BD311DRAFT_766718 [Dichomitus squalens]|uniref:J domain-containing protein n=2 Tax=Dichomitus squalens TaxID=114155 RepID=A0A4Q9MCP9_9APHY|nr:hypothetical protein BD311DRAFT_766718 [Dichomitus squalens]
MQINCVMHKHLSLLRLSGASHARYASTSAGPYPFPAHAHPTPHQIFHLPLGASQKEIKARYYDLVRVHHPDAPCVRDLSPAIRRSRFQAITAAYDILRGKKSGSFGGTGDIYRDELLRRKRAWAAHEQSRRRSGPLWEETPARGWTASADDRWKDRVILFVGILALGAGLGPALIWPSYTASQQAHLSASRNLAQARKEAREFGEERRKEINRRVQEYKEKQAKERPPEEVMSSSTS